MSSQCVNDGVPLLRRHGNSRAFIAWEFAVANSSISVWIRTSNQRFGLNRVQVGEFTLSERVVRKRITTESKGIPSGVTP